MRVLVTRARADADRTAARLAAAGHAAIVAPVIAIVGTGAALPAGPFDAVLATSVHAIAAFAELPSALAGMPWLVVGERLQDALASRGHAASAVAPDVSALMEGLHQLYTQPARFLYLAGRDRKPDLERHLAAWGHTVHTIETYEAKALPVFDAVAAVALRRGEVDAALHFSRRSARLLYERAASAGLAEFVAVLRHIAISEDAAAPLRDAGWNVAVATYPAENGMIELLGSQGP